MSEPAPTAPPFGPQVAPGARWRACRKHGATVAPLVEKQRFKNGTLHLAALCPTCRKSLGFLPRRRHIQVASPAEMERVYRRFLTEAKATGARPGQAYFRFKVRFGIAPDPAWRVSP